MSFAQGKPTVASAGPNELIAGFWSIQVNSKEDAIEWTRRIPFEKGVVEIRQIFDACDFPAEILPPEEAAREDAWRRGAGVAAGTSA